MITHLHVVPNLCDLLYSVEHNGRHRAEYKLQSPLIFIAGKNDAIQVNSDEVNILPNFFCEGEWPMTVLIVV